MRLMMAASPLFSEPSEGSVIGESFHAHWFGGDEVDDGCVSTLHHLWVVFKDFATTSVNFLFEFSEFASDVSCVAIQYWLVSCSDLSWVVQDDDLSFERFCFLCGITL